MPKNTNETPKKRKWEERFLVAFEHTVNVSKAAKKVGIARSTAYTYRKDNPEFKRKWDDIEDARLDDLEVEGYRRAEEESDTLLIFILKARRPARYNPTKNVRIDGSIEHSIDAAKVAKSFRDAVLQAVIDEEAEGNTGSIQ